MLVRLIAAVSLLVVLGGCVTVGHSRGEAQTLPAPLERTWPVATQLLQERGFYVERSNDGQYVVTRWREDFSGSKIATRWTRYTVIGEEVHEGRSRIRFFRHEGTNQDVIPHSNNFGSEQSAIEAEKSAQRSSAEGSTSRRFHARVNGDPEEERTFQAKPATISVSRDDAMELELLARLQGRTVPASAEDAPSAAQASAAPSSTELLDELSEQLCGPAVPGWSEVLTPRSTILLGEIPGTQEVPQLMSGLACDALVRGHPVVLALELPAKEQERIDAFLASDGGVEAQARLLEGFFWNRPLQDGRSSKAMLHLLEEARLLRSAGHPLRVRAIDVPGLVGAERSVAMAEGVVTARGEARAAVILALVGNLHIVARGDAPPTTMAGALVAAGEPVISLTLAYSRGTAWNCDDSERVECGPRSFAADASHFRTWRWATPPSSAFHVRSPSIRRWSSRNDGIDGTFYLDELSASEPASK